MKSPVPKRPVIRLAPHDRRCASCGFEVAALVEVAHVPNWRTDPDKWVPLCLLCHRAYDIGLMTEDEVEAIRDGWKAGRPPPYDAAELWRLWASREPTWSKLQQGAGRRAGLTRRRKAAARRAVATKASRMTKD